MNIGQQWRNLDDVAGSQHLEQVAFPFSIGANKATDAGKHDVYGVT